MYPIDSIGVKQRNGPENAISEPLNEDKTA